MGSTLLPIQWIASRVEAADGLKGLGAHQFLVRLLQVLEELGVADGDGDLIGHCLQADDILIAEGGLLHALDGDCADDLVTDAEGQRHLRTGIGEVGVLEMHRFSPHPAHTCLAGETVRSSKPGDFQVCGRVQNFGPRSPKRGENGGISPS